MNEPIIKIFENNEINYSQVYMNLEKYFEISLFQQSHQLCITSKNGQDLFDGIGSLYDSHSKKFIAHTSLFNQLNTPFKGTEMETIYESVKEIAERNYGVKIGRVRLMRLRPKSCYSYHIDPEEFRFHIPLKTNKNCFFVVDDIVARMTDENSLYILKTSEVHTAVNASFTNRDHLVFDTYK